MRGVLCGSALLLGMVVSMALNVSGCGDHCECPDVPSVYFGDPGTYVFYDIVEEDFSGSPDSSAQYTWAESTWVDVLGVSSRSPGPMWWLATAPKRPAS